MAVVRCPSNVSSITLVTSGALAPASGLITCTALEATDLVQSYNAVNADGIVDTVLAGGAVRFQLPKSITSITINGNVRVPDATGIIASIPAADASIFGQIKTYRTALFELVTG
jgi:hypothetical protein